MRELRLAEAVVYLTWGVSQNEHSGFQYPRSVAPKWWSCLWFVKCRILEFNTPKCRAQSNWPALWGPKKCNQPNKKSPQGTHSWDPQEFNVPKFCLSSNSTICFQIQFYSLSDSIFFYTKTETYHKCFSFSPTFYSQIPELILNIKPDPTKLRCHWVDKMANPSFRGREVQRPRPGTTLPHRLRSHTWIYALDVRFHLTFKAHPQDRLTSWNMLTRTFNMSSHANKNVTLWLSTLCN